MAGVSEGSSSVAGQKWCGGGSVACDQRCWSGKRGNWCGQWSSSYWGDGGRSHYWSKSDAIVVTCDNLTAGGGDDRRRSGDGQRSSGKDVRFSGSAGDGSKDYNGLEKFQR